MAAFTTYVSLASVAADDDKELKRKYEGFRRAVTSATRAWERRESGRSIDVRFISPDRAIELSASRRPFADVVEEVVCDSGTGRTHAKRIPQLAWSSETEVTIGIRAERFMDCYLMHVDVFADTDVPLPDTSSEHHAAHDLPIVANGVAEEAGVATASFGHGVVLYAEFDGPDDPSPTSLNEAVRRLVTIWRRNNGAESDVFDAVIEASSFGYVAVLHDHAASLFVLLVRKEAVEETRSALYEILPPLHIGDAKIRDHGALIDIMAVAGKKARDDLEQALRKARAAMKAASGRRGLSWGGRELDAIEAVADRLPAVSQHRDEVANALHTIEINLRNVRSYLARLHGQPTDTTLDRVVLDELMLHRQQAEADLGYIDQLLKRTEMELAATEAASGIRSLRWERTTSYILMAVAFLAFLGIPQAFPELYEGVPGDWSWLAAAAPAVRWVVLVIAAITSVAFFSIIFVELARLLVDGIRSMGPPDQED